MRFMIMHRTSPRWEAGETPDPALIARVGAMLGELAETGVLRAAEGLRASALGVRLRFSEGRRTVLPGPFTPSNELPSGFVILRVDSLDEAVAWATRLAEATGDGELDVRPVTEPLDIGMAPPPRGVRGRRIMALRKADAASEAGLPLSPARRAELDRVLEAMRRAGVLLAAEGLAPSARAVRLRDAGGRRTVIDGPFAESKELIAGYVVVEAPSLRDAAAWAHRYADAVGCPELDVREVAERF